ncbi:MAG: ribosome-associated translation inhibitor RaiA [Anaerolineales bacterium]
MATSVEIFGREMQVDKTLEDYVQSRAEKLDRYLDGVETVRVELGYKKGAKSADDRYKAQITLRGKKFVLRAEERTDQVSSAFDAALDKIQRQMERYKGKHYQNKIKAAPTTQEIIEAETSLAERPVEKIGRTKKFLLLPMNAAEAVEQMALLGHEQFFIFYNMDEACVSVLYKRGDGNYGLINTELA